MKVAIGSKQCFAKSATRLASKLDFVYALLLSRRLRLSGCSHDLLAGLRLLAGVCYPESLISCLHWATVLLSMLSYCCVHRHLR